MGAQRIASVRALRRWCRLTAPAMAATAIRIAATSRKVAGRLSERCAEVR